MEINTEFFGFLITLGFTVVSFAQHCITGKALPEVLLKKSQSLYSGTHFKSKKYKNLCFIFEPKNLFLSLFLAYVI